ncbi:hypothetical protein FIBSPDRAFT_148975 [Athelia psychrophila]|uniref:Uncharacterized protein n=1 Tax=Athelia psychrophila TaxID=1759441 RepID=A0A166BQ41_9AGAM|nr:hypothetical protein FIBSPDRAFT_454844 [Fibularhizoctonia sp. CBS 109695]KZP12869.1 hypothetical protein FIBSPDRAFT_148975 [Fibularhizoctonia sp. CBS 109695]
MNIHHFLGGAMSRLPPSNLRLRPRLPPARHSFWPPSDINDGSLVDAIVTIRCPS